MASLVSCGLVEVDHEGSAADEAWRAGDAALRRGAGPDRRPGRSSGRHSRGQRQRGRLQSAAGAGGVALNLFPHILGRDFSGVVSAVGAGVTDLAVGDAVFGVCDQGIEGAYAEKIAIKAAIIAKKPERLGHAEAAAMALTGLTALWALEDTAQLKAGETILIQGGAGGVAGFGIQLAKHIGATVITTASAGNHDYVRRLGADRVIDYNAEDFTNRSYL